jgi:hypothetical protein
LSNTATISAPAGVTDTNSSNNSATDTDTLASATTPVLNFPNGFAGAASQFSFNGTSSKIVASNLQLTDGGKSEAASIFAITPVNVARFTTSFNVQLLNGTNPSADGMTFTIQNTGLKALGGNGGNLAYNGITKSVAVKFDLYSNSGEGANSTGLYTNGANPSTTNSINLTGTGIDLHSGHVLNVSMAYDGTTLLVTIIDTVTQAKATQSYAVNIPAIVGGNTAYVGFTGSTGGLTATQNVLNWTYTVTPAAAAPAARPILAPANDSSAAHTKASTGVQPVTSLSALQSPAIALGRASGESNRQIVTGAIRSAMQDILAVASLAQPPLMASIATSAGVQSTTSSPVEFNSGPRDVAARKSVAQPTIDRGLVHDVALDELSLEHSYTVPSTCNRSVERMPMSLRKSGNR